MLQFIDNMGVTDPRFNLALEEHALQTMDPAHECVLFYVNAPSVIIGRHQNTVEEIDRDVVESEKIHVVRRISGGGAVYHDSGNLNFSFMTRYSKAHFRDFARFTEPVIAALRSIGVPAEAGGRNDIVAKGRKISGNAQYVSHGRMFSHGTLLLDTDLDTVARVLNVRAEKIASKGIKSVRSRVANISEFLDQPMEMSEFRELVLRHIFAGASPVPLREMSSSDLDAVRRLADEKYGDWDWNYGASPRFNLQRSQRFSGGLIDARLLVEKGRIAEVRFFGDFFARKDVNELEERLTGVRHDRSEIAAALEQTDLADYFGSVARDEFVALLS